MHRHVLFLIAFAAALRPSATEAQVTRGWFDQFISGIELPAVPAIAPRHGTPVAGTMVNADGVRIPTTTQPISEQKSVHEFIVLAPNAGQVWPGNVIQYRGLSSGLLNPVGVGFTDRILTVDVPRLGADGERFTRRVQKAHYGATLDTLGSILRSLPQTTAAEMSFTESRVFDAEHARFAVGLGANWPGGHLDAFLEEISRTARTNLLYEFNQVYYTASVERPTSPSQFLRTGIFRSRSNVRRYMGPDNPPAYISSVTYGRRIYLNIASSEREDVVKRTFDAVFRALQGSGNVHLSDEDRRIYNASSITAVIVGGAADEAARLIRNPTPEQLRQLILSGANFSADSPGRPLSYSVRYLRDNTVASVGVPGEWSEYHEGSLLYRKPFRATVSGEGFVFIDTADNDEDVDWDIRLEALGQDGQVVGVFERSIRDRHVYEAGKDHDRCKNNCFYRGESLFANQPVFQLRYTVRVSTRDGDGKRWGTNTGVVDVMQPTVRISGGHDGEWNLHLTFGSS